MEMIPCTALPKSNSERVADLDRNNGANDPINIVLWNGPQRRYGWFMGVMGRLGLPRLPFRCRGASNSRLKTHVALFILEESR